MVSLSLSWRCFVRKRESGLFNGALARWVSPFLCSRCCWFGVGGRGARGRRGKERTALEVITMLGRLRELGRSSSEDADDGYHVRFLWGSSSAWLAFGVRASSSFVITQLTHIYAVIIRIEEMWFDQMIKDVVWLLLLRSGSVGSFSDKELGDYEAVDELVGEQIHRGSSQGQNQTKMIELKK